MDGDRRGSMGLKLLPSQVGSGPSFCHRTIYLRPGNPLLHGNIVCVNAQGKRKLQCAKAG